MSNNPTRSQMITSLIAYQTQAVTEAIAEGEDPNCFDLSGARMYYEDLNYDELQIAYDELSI